MHTHLNSISIGSFGKNELGDLWQGIQKNKPREEEIRQLEKVFLSEKLELAAQNIFFLKQEHTCISHLIKAQDIEKNQKQIYYEKGDALYTLEKNICLVIRTADCVPFFFILETEKIQALALIHAGWRGLEKNIIGHTIQKVLKEITQEKLSKLAIKYYCGSHASFSKYEIKADVARYFPKQYLKKQYENSYLLNMLDLAKDQACEALGSFSKESYQYLNNLESCTMNSNNQYFSHRKQELGRNLHYIFKK